MKKVFVFFSLVFVGFCIAQTGNVSFEITDAKTNQVLKSVLILDLINGQEYDFFESDSIQIQNLNVGVYTFSIENEAYETELIFETEVSPNINKKITVELTPLQNNLNEVVARSNTFSKTSESPLSLRNMTSQEITRNPGSNRDISKVIRSLPGVTSTASFRNDLLIRGGGPNENRFFIDGIETPVINHFATQGASGGPKGMINVDFLKDVDFYSSAFPSNRGNALSSVFDFTFKNPSTDKLHLKAVAGLDDFSLMAEGSLLEDKSLTYMASVRQSNLQFLFKAFDLPFLPKYQDFQTKINKTFKNGDQLYFFGLGAIDDMSFNFDAEKTDQNLLILDALPLNSQWNYTLGLGYIKNEKNGKWEFIASRNMLNNRADKYYKNIEIPSNKIIDYESEEVDNRLRVERKFYINNYEFNLGLGYNNSEYRNDSEYKYITQNGIFNEFYNTDLQFNTYYGFIQSSAKYLENKLRISAGIRFDANDYSNELSKLGEQFSPRVALSYQFIPKWYFNFATGIYYQLPHYTAMGYKETGSNELANKNQLDFMSNTHFAAGFEYNSKQNLKITLEGYYKKYKNYPFSIRNGVNLANLGGDFGVVGIEPVTSTGFGRTYGLEFLVQQRSSKNIYGILSYTLGWSEFNDENGKYIPSAWDARHILSLTAGKKLKNNWDVGLRFRLQSALPQTPFDLDRSALVQVWDINNSAVPDYTKLNTERGDTANQLDIRVEKKWYYNKWSLSLYLDAVNIYGGSTGDSREVISLVRDDQGNGIIENPSAPINQQRYQLKLSDPDPARPLPYIGIIIEW